VGGLVQQGVQDLPRVLGQQLARDEQLGRGAGLGGQLPAVGRVVAASPSRKRTKAVKLRGGKVTRSRANGYLA
jgi:hypothetical protein